jgi:hypothetical protein
MTDEYDAILNPPPFPTPDWSRWRYESHAMLWEAAALACGVAPDALAAAFLHQPPAKFEHLKNAALAGLSTNRLVRPKDFKEANPEDSVVSLNAFGAWARSMGYTLPADFPRDITPEAIQAHGWPWGSHTTDLLESLAAAAHRFWVKYDPADPTTAPTNEDVCKWLMEHRNVGKRNAEVMATILRDPAIKTGPR